MLASKAIRSGVPGSNGASAIASAPAMMTRTRTETARVPINGAAISSAPVRSIVHRMALTMPKACWPSMTIWVAGSIASRPRRQPIR
ncbi:hypothetical protein D9M69_616950 [compost metagenome]